MAATLSKHQPSDSSHRIQLIAAPLSHGSNLNSNMAGASVRRLTPTECERLQALPDGWTNPDGKAADSRRYAGLGDAVTASVGEWIGHRIILQHVSARVA